MKSNLDIFETQIFYTPVWVTASKQIGRGIPCKTALECEEVLKGRVEYGLHDRMYQIEVTTKVYGLSKVEPLGQEKET